MKISARSVKKLVRTAGFAVWGLAALGVSAQSPAPTQHGVAERSTTLTLTLDGVSKQLTKADLSRMTQSTLTVHNSHTNREEHYTGVALVDMLSAAGLPFTKDTQQSLLHSYVRAQGTDFYFVLYSASELEPELNTSQVIVATAVDGQDLGEDGQFKLISSADKRPARWVRNLLSLTLVTLN